MFWLWVLALQYVTYYRMINKTRHLLNFFIKTLNIIWVSRKIYYLFVQHWRLYVPNKSIIQSLIVFVSINSNSPLVISFRLLMWGNAYRNLFQNIGSPHLINIWSLRYLFSSSSNSSTHSRSLWITINIHRASWCAARNSIWLQTVFKKFDERMMMVLRDSLTDTAIWNIDIWTFIENLTNKISYLWCNPISFGST